MGCEKIRETLEDLAEIGAIEGADPELMDHVNKCAECADYLRQMRRVWVALEAYPTIELSADFSQRLRRRLSQSGPLEAPAGWRWMAIAACALLIAAPIVYHSYDTPPNSVTRSDQQDEIFLRDLEQTLEQNTTGYLRAYDSWSQDEGQTEPELSRPKTERRGSS